MVCNCFDGFEQVNSGWLISDVFNWWINLKSKTCIEFVINNVSPQCNVKIILNSKVEEICRDCSPIFLWIKWQRTRILFSLIRSIFITLWNTLWSVLQKKSTVNTVNFFTESSILDVSLGSEHVSDYPKFFSIIIKWRFHFEFFMNVSNLISILLSYLGKKFSR